MANLAATACRRCRDQKLRCSREQPECARCVRLSAVCSYPEPPDRKLLAATRKPPKRKKVDEYAGPLAGPTKHSTSTGVRDDGITAQTAAWLQYTQTNPSSPIPDDEIKKPETPVLPAHVQTVLLDAYFTCTFNAPLIFHRPTFQHEYAENSVPQHTLLAIFALAMNFLKPASALGRQHAPALQQLGDLVALGRQLALRAGRQVLQTVDRPKIHSIQTCQILALYWFSQGESQRNTMFSGISYRAIRTLLLEVRSEDSLDETLGWVEAETVRRCFWAAVLVYCINADHYVVGSSSDVLAMNTTLPSSEHAFLQSTVEPAFTLYQLINDTDEHREARTTRQPSVFAELMKLLHCWARIRDHIEAKRLDSDRHQLSSLFKLHDELSSWSVDLPPPLSYSKRNLYQQLFVEQEPIFIALHAIHLQCRLVLHSSVVPQFSGVELPRGVPLEAVRVSAEVALKAAQGLSQLGADILALDFDAAQVAPFVGYCMYVASSVHMTVLSKDERLGVEARRNLSRSLKLLKAMKPFWSVLERLWERTQVLYEAQMAKLQADYPAVSSADQTQSPYSNELDKLAGTVRGAEGLSEPLQDSVLRYSLRRLNRNGSVNRKASDSASELDQMIADQSNDVAEVMQQTTASEPMSHFKNDVPLVSTSEPLQSVDPMLLPPGSLDIDPDILPFGLDPGSDWWQMPWDDESQARLSFDEFFGLSGKM